MSEIATYSKRTRGKRLSPAEREYIWRADLNDSERCEEWVRYYNVCLLKMNALRAVLLNDGEAMLQMVLQKLKLKTAADVVKACKET
jgi:hypothetical protein